MRRQLSKRNILKSDMELSQPACPDWTNLLGDVFETLLTHLGTREIVDVRLTCKSWRAKTDLLLQGLRTHETNISALVKRFPGLAHLWVTCGVRCPPDAVQVAALVQLCRLQTLSMDARCDLPAPPYFMAGLHMLAARATLANVHLCGVTLTAEAGLGALVQLRSLHLQECSLAQLPALPLTLTECTRLEELVLESCVHSSLAPLQGLGTLTQLASLTLSGSLGISDALCAEISSLLKLTKLVLARSGVEGGGPSLSITDAGVLHLIGLQRLQHLSLAGNWAISDVGVGALCASLTGLRFLDLRRPPSAVPGLAPAATLTDASLHHIASLQLLEKLRLSEAQVGESGCAAISRLKTLRSLQLSQCSSLWDSAACKLTALTGLTELYLAGCSGLTNIAVANLARKLTLLERLDLSGCHRHLTEIGVQAIAKLPRLQMLRLASCDRIGTKGIAALSSLTTLTDLDLSNCEAVSDEAVESLGRSLTRLQTLNVEYCLKLTDKGLAALAPMTALQDLRVCGTSVSSDAHMTSAKGQSLKVTRQKRLWWMT